MPLTTGTRLGPYEILAPIGKGGMGEVYKATDTRLGRTVAISGTSPKTASVFSSVLPLKNKQPPRSPSF